MKKIALFLIGFYQKYLSLDTGIIGVHFSRGKTCGFHPTCSEYTKQAIEKYGFWRGSYLGIKRIWRCRPSNGGTIDPLV
jgi:uncharacterized protein